MPLQDYPTYFQSMAADPTVMFENADLYPTAYHTLRVTTYTRTNAPLTNNERLISLDHSYATDRAIYRMIAWNGLGKWLRHYLVDPIYFHTHLVEWRNREASYRVEELEPASRLHHTYVLQEYFVPDDALLPFAAQMGKFFQDNHVNVINVSIRHSKRDPGTVLAWAKTDVFALVVYYRQGVSASDKAAVTHWTRELIEAVNAYHGSFLPALPGAGDRRAV